MDLEMENKIKDLDLFREKEIEIIPLGTSSKEKKTVFLIDCKIPIDGEDSKKYRKMKYLLRIEDGQNTVKFELESWLLLAKKNLSVHRPEIYYIDSNFKFSISEFYEGYTSIDTLELSQMDKEVISKYLLKLSSDYQTITSEVFDLKAVVKKELTDLFKQGIQSKFFQEEDLQEVIKFVNQIEFGTTATYNHCALSMKNILYNKETKETKIVHMKDSKFTEPIYDYIYMIKNLDREISHVFMPAIENYNPKIVQVLSLLCDLKTFLSHERRISLQSIYTQIENIKAQLPMMKN